MIGCLPTQALAFLAAFVYATHATQALAFEWIPGLSRCQQSLQSPVAPQICVKGESGLIEVRQRSWSCVNSVRPNYKCLNVRPWLSVGLTSQPIQAGNWNQRLFFCKIRSSSWSFRHFGVRRVNTAWNVKLVDSYMKNKRAKFGAKIFTRLRNCGFRVGAFYFDAPCIYVIVFVTDVLQTSWCARRRPITLLLMLMMMMMTIKV